MSNIMQQITEWRRTGLTWTYLDGNPLRGERLVLAHLRNVCSIRLTRDQTRDSVARVDPGGFEGRRCQMLRRLVRRTCLCQDGALLLLVRFGFPPSPSPFIVHGCRRVIPLSPAVCSSPPDTTTATTS
jgi:hypothetical protein